MPLEINTAERGIKVLTQPERGKKSQRKLNIPSWRTHGAAERAEVKRDERKALGVLGVAEMQVLKFREPRPSTSPGWQQGGEPCPPPDVPLESLSCPESQSCCSSWLWHKVGLDVPVLEVVASLLG